MECPRPPLAKFEPPDETHQYAITDALQLVGPAPINIEKLTLENENFRHVIHTIPGEVQTVLMSIKDFIPREIHEDTTQIFRVEGGQISITTEHEGIPTSNVVQAGGYFIVPKKTYHAVNNTTLDGSPAKLYTIYIPPHHPPDRIQRDRPIDD